MSRVQVQVGEVWFARIPYNDTARDQDTTGNKFRPVVVIGYSPGVAPDEVILIVPITSFGNGGQAGGGDVKIQNTRRAGLTKESWVRARRVMGIHPRSLEGQRSARGRVSSSELDAIYREILQLIE